MEYVLGGEGEPRRVSGRKERARRGESEGSEQRRKAPTLRSPESKLADLKL